LRNRRDLVNCRHCGRSVSTRTAVNCANCHDYFHRDCLKRVRMKGGRFRYMMCDECIRLYPNPNRVVEEVEVE